MQNGWRGIPYYQQFGESVVKVRKTGTGVVNYFQVSNFARQVKSLLKIIYQ
jgi:hypothetical protein